jgi:hypothetical protein
MTDTVILAMILGFLVGQFLLAPLLRPYLFRFFDRIADWWDERKYKND